MATFLIVLIVAAAVIGLAVCIYLTLRDKTLEEIREEVYQLFLKAEHKFTESGSGKKKMQYVIEQARLLLPNWLEFFITQEFLEMLIEGWFQAVKDLLDDGKMNGTAQTEVSFDE